MKFIQFYFYFNVFILNLIFVSCSHNNSSPTEKVLIRKSPIIGAIKPVVQSLKGGERFSECDQKNYDLMIKISEDLDEKADEIDNFLSNLPRASLYR